MKTLALLLALAPAAYADAPASRTGGIIKFNEPVAVAAGEHVDGPVIVFGHDAAVDGGIDGPVIAFGGSVRLGPKAAIDGPVLSLGGRTVRADGSVVDGPVVDTPGGEFLAKIAVLLGYAAAAGAGAYVLLKASTSVGWIVIGLVLTALFPKALQRTKNTLDAHWAPSLLIGLAAWPALAVITITLALSLIGLPLIPLLWGLAAAAYVWGFTALAYVVGEKVSFARWSSAFVSVTVGMALLKLLQWVPVAQWLVCAAAALWGVGAAMLSGFGLRNKS